MGKIIEPNKVYDVKEAAELLNSNSQTITEYCREGKIVAQKIGEWKILGQSLISFLNGTADRNSQVRRSISKETQAELKKALKRQNE